MNTIVNDNTDEAQLCFDLHFLSLERSEEEEEAEEAAARRQLPPPPPLLLLAFRAPAAEALAAAFFGPEVAGLPALPTEVIQRLR